MANPQEQVFDTIELLEMILYKLPIRDLLLSQRVSCRWKQVIEGSIKLQQALFIKSITGPVAMTVDGKLSSYSFIWKVKLTPRTIRSNMALQGGSGRIHRDGLPTSPESSHLTITEPHQHDSPIRISLLQKSTISMVSSGSVMERDAPHTAFHLHLSCIRGDI